MTLDGNAIPLDIAAIREPFLNASPNRTLVHFQRTAGTTPNNHCGYKEWQIVGQWPLNGIAIPKHASEFRLAAAKVFNVDVAAHEDKETSDPSAGTPDTPCVQFKHSRDVINGRSW